MFNSYKRMTPTTSFTISVLPCREDFNESPISSSVDVPSVDFLFSVLTSDDTDQIIQSLSNLSFLPSTSFAFSGLPGLLLNLLSQNPSVEVHSLCFRILSKFLKLSDSFSNLPEIPTLTTLESFRVLLMNPTERFHELRLYHFLKFAVYLSHLAMETYHFDRFISLLQRCLDSRCHPRIVRQCYHLSIEILSHNQKTELAFLDHEFVSLSLRYINSFASNVRAFSEEKSATEQLQSDRDKTFCVACEFMQRLCTNNCKIVDYLPENIMEFCADVLELCNDSQTEAFFGFLHGMAMNHLLFPMFFSKRFVNTLVEAMNERPFRIAFESVVLLTTMMKEAPELMEECILNIGTLDGFVRFFDTQNVSLIADILIGVWTLANRYLVNRPDLTKRPDLLSLFENSEVFVEKIQELIEDVNDPEKYIPQNVIESAGMLMTALSHEFMTEDEISPL